MNLNVIKSPLQLDSILDLNPQETIIIGGEIEVYKSCGYYYSFESLSDEDLQSLEETINSVGVSEYYEFMRAMYVEEMLSKSKQEYKTPVLAIQGLLEAFKKNDYLEIKDIISYQLEDMLSTVKFLSSMFDVTESEMTYSLKYVKLRKVYKKLLIDYNSLVSEISVLREKSNNAVELYDLNEKISKLESTIKSLESKNAELNIELNASKKKSSSFVTKDEFDALNEEYTLLSEKYEKLMKENSEKHANQTSVFSTANDQVIVALKERIMELQESQTSMLLDKLPILTDTSIILKQGAKVMLFKDLKNSTCMNDFVLFIDLYCSKLSRRGRSVISVVIDSLNGLTTTVYKKYDFAVNEILQRKDSCTVITNRTDIEFYRDDLALSQYDLIVVIDRTGSDRLAMNRKDMKKYYLIDSPSDLVDYNLKPEDCIATFSEVNPRMVENSIDSGNSSTEKLSYKCYANITIDETYPFKDRSSRLSMFAKNLLTLLEE